MEDPNTNGYSPILKDDQFVGCPSYPNRSPLRSPVENPLADSLPECSSISAVATPDASSSPSIQKAGTLTEQISESLGSNTDLRSWEGKSLAEPLTDANDGDAAGADDLYSSMQLEASKEDSDSSSSSPLRLVDDDGDDFVDNRRQYCFSFGTRERRDYMQHRPASRWYSGEPWCYSQENEGDSRPWEHSPIRNRDSRPWEHSPIRNRDRREDRHSGFGTTWLEVGPTGVGAGLSNLGNTCFVNAILQCFTHTVPFVKALRSSNHAMPCTTSGFCVLCALRDHVERSLASSGKTISPSQLVDNLNHISPFFRRYQQEDAHEFLQSLLDRLQRCCLDSSPRDESSCPQDGDIVQQVFGGRLVSKLQCCNCGHCSDTYEPLIDLSLEMSEEVETLQDILESFTKVEKIEESSTCENCKEEVSRTKQLMLDQVPSVVTLHLKRFKTDGSSVEKIGKHVDFPLEMDFKPFVSGTDGSNQGELKYQLYAIVVHNGNSPTYGHYFCYIRSSQDTWHKLDDSMVIKFQAEFVLSQSAYILFYAREGIPWPSSLIQPPKLPIFSKESPKSVLDNVEDKQTLCTSISATKTDDFKAGLSSAVAERTSPQSFPGTMMGRIEITESDDETESIEVEIYGRSSSDVPMQDISMSPDDSEKTCTVPSVEENNCDGSADINGRDGLHPATPPRSPNPETNQVPEAKYMIPQNHPKVVNRTHSKKSPKMMVSDAEKREVVRYLKNSPQSRRDQLLAAVGMDIGPKREKTGARSSLCKRGSPPGPRRHRLAVSR